MSSAPHTVSGCAAQSLLERADPFRKSLRLFLTEVDRLSATLGYDDDYEPPPRQRSDAVWTAAVAMQDEPALAAEAVTGVRCWYADMSIGEARLLQQWADRMFEDAARNNEGTERLNQLLAASLALTWIVERMEERREDDTFCRAPAPYLQSEFL